MYLLRIVSLNLRSFAGVEQRVALSATRYFYDVVIVISQTHSSQMYQFGIVRLDIYM